MRHSKYSNSMERLASPFVMIIFGATGDLSKRKLLPSLFHLFHKKALPPDFRIIGFSRRSWGDKDYVEFAKQAILTHAKHTREFDRDWPRFARHLSYQQGKFDEKCGYQELIEKLAIIDKSFNACVPRYFYLATPPQEYASILDHLDATKLSEGCGQGSDKWTKVMVEKPFGRDFEDAKKLDAKLSKIFNEQQIYRIDHYLGKQTVQNIVAFRYGNTIFDAIWNRQFIDHVQITIAEELGVETRGNFYEGVGALRDMAQSHLLQLLAAVAMKPTRTAEQAVRDARAAIIKSIKPFKEEEVKDKVVRGQYGSPMSNIKYQISNQDQIQKSKTLSYREEPNVDPDSNTETFVALKLELTDHRWKDVPFYLRTGKRLATKTTQISIIFKEPRLKLFDSPKSHETNVLTFRIEPNEGIELGMRAKAVGLDNEIEPIPLSFTYQKERALPEAYERILLDCLRGDQLLFTRTDEVLAEWHIISHIVSAWQVEKPRFPNYAPGSWGPASAVNLLRKDGREWILK